MVAATTLIDTAQAAFERLFAAEYRRVTSVAFRITRDTAEAEDVAQEVFAQFARSRRGLEGAPAWLYRAAIHRALNAVRARKRREQRESREYVLQRPLDEHFDPQQLAESYEDAAMIRSALLRIGRAHAEILALRYGGLSYREIADIVGVAAAQIGTRLARAEHALKREIEREASR